MNDQAEMFPGMEETPSPRRKWLQDHDVHTFETPGLDAEAWSAWIGDLDDAVSMGGDNPEAGGYAKGDTEEDAIVALATARKIPLWNEEAFTADRNK